MSAKFKPQFFAERLAALEALEEVFQNAHDNRVDADPFRLCPLSQRGSGFCAEMEELRPGKLQTCLAGLLNLHFFPINLAQGEENNPRQIAFHARLLRDCFSQINRKPERHSWSVAARVLRFFDRSPGFLLYYHKRTSRFHTAFL